MKDTGEFHEEALAELVLLGEDLHAGGGDFAAAAPALATGFWTSFSGRMEASLFSLFNLPENLREPGADFGLTTRDRSTGEYYCVFVDKGVLFAAKGECPRLK